MMITFNKPKLIKISSNIYLSCACGYLIGAGK